MKSYVYMFHSTNDLVTNAIIDRITWLRNGQSASSCIWTL